MYSRARLINIKVVDERSPTLFPQETLWTNYIMFLCSTVSEAGILLRSIEITFSFPLVIFFVHNLMMNSANFLPKSSGTWQQEAAQLGI